MVKSRLNLAKMAKIQSDLTGSRPFQAKPACRNSATTTGRFQIPVAVAEKYFRENYFFKKWFRQKYFTLKQT